MQTYRRSYKLGLGLVLLFISSITTMVSAATITFDARDGLPITADSYTPLAANAPLIVLFHQAGFSRGEYQQIAPKLNQLGFNAIAIDLRAGKSALGVINQTALAAKKTGLAPRYTDALPDIIDSLEYARKQFPDARIIAWGSSYSAALVLKIAGDNPQLIDAVLAFSPGEYFARLGKSPSWIQDAAMNIQAPVFISSARDEAQQWASIYAAIKPTLRNSFIPVSAGKHGSKALWEQQPDNEAYWAAVTAFLRPFLSAP